MRTVRINKGELVNTLIKNRNIHKAEYQEAVKGYCATQSRWLEEVLSTLKAGTPVSVWSKDQPPEDHTENYNTALKMLEMSVDNVIELTQDEFHHFVLDNWDWKANWKASNTKYLIQR